MDGSDRLDTVEVVVIGHRDFSTEITCHGRLGDLVVPGGAVQAGGVNGVDSGRSVTGLLHSVEAFELHSLEEGSEDGLG